MRLWSSTLKFTLGKCQMFHITVSKIFSLAGFHVIVCISDNTISGYSINRLAKASHPSFDGVLIVRNFIPICKETYNGGSSNFLNLFTYFFMWPGGLVFQWYLLKCRVTACLKAAAICFKYQTVRGPYEGHPPPWTFYWPAQSFKYFETDSTHGTKCLAGRRTITYKTLFVSWKPTMSQWILKCTLFSTLVLLMSRQCFRTFRQN